MNASPPTDQSPSAFVSGDFVVLINHEEQYALWPVNKPVPEKWRPAGVSGSKEECLAYVRRVWTDMRPLSIRQRDQARKSGDESV
jgi:MbtH protein